MQYGLGDGKIDTWWIGTLVIFFPQFNFLKFPREVRLSCMLFLSWVNTSCHVRWVMTKMFIISFFYFILFNFTILYWFCHISKWICHRHTCVPHPEPSSILPPHTGPLGRPSAPSPSIQYRASNLDWRLI